MPREFQTVEEAMRRVTCRSNGIFTMPTADIAEELSNAIVERYPHEGYFTMVTVRDNVVDWSVGSAD